MKPAKISILVMLLGMSLIAAGLMLGAYRGVWQKASLICLECIGFG